jgi:hypothetical protein
MDACADPHAWRDLMSNHLQRYPAMEIPDALKLLQQAAAGSEHAALDPASAEAWMEREWSTMAGGPTEPMIDTLGVGGQFARVHLRPYRDNGGAPAQLTAAFVATANAERADTGVLGCALIAVAAAVPWDSARWRAEVAAWAKVGYPAMHHSPGYESAYRPAYRVVAVSKIPVIPDPEANRP